MKRHGVVALARRIRQERFDRNLSFLEHPEDRFPHDARCTDNRDPHEITSGKSRDSSPIVKPDSLRTFFTARTIPGPNESRERESWRMVSVSPRPPKSTSWCATYPGKLTLSIATSAGPPASAMRRAVSLAVPLGASF